MAAQGTGKFKITTYDYAKMDELHEFPTLDTIEKSGQQALLPQDLLKTWPAVHRCLRFYQGEVDGGTAVFGYPHTGGHPVLVVPVFDDDMYTAMARAMAYAFAAAEKTGYVHDPALNFPLSRSGGSFVPLPGPVGSAGYGASYFGAEHVLVDFSHCDWTELEKGNVWRVYIVNCRDDITPSEYGVAIGERLDGEYILPLTSGDFGNMAGALQMDVVCPGGKPPVVSLEIAGGQGRYFLACYPTKRSGGIISNCGMQLMRAQTCTCCLPFPTNRVTGGEKNLPKTLLGLVPWYSNPVTKLPGKSQDGGEITIVELAYRGFLDPMEGIAVCIPDYSQNLYKSKPFVSRFFAGFRRFGGYAIWNQPAFRWFLEKTLAIVTILPDFDPSLDPLHEMTYMYRPQLDEKLPGAPVSLRSMLQTFIYLAKVSPSKVPTHYSQIGLILEEDNRMEDFLVVSEPWDKVPFAN